jgi:CheY-like chemotaxis protein
MPVGNAGLTANDSRARRLVDTVGGESAAKRRPPAVSNAATSPEVERPLRVLIADDHPILTELLLRTFHSHDWIEVVGCAANGRDAVMLASAAKPDLILMDIEMPIMDGIEATRRILARMSTVVLVLTASAPQGDREIALAAGARAVLPKTIDPALLVGHLQNVFLEHAAATAGLRRGA